MSDTVKLIIEIPKEDYEWVQTHQSVTDYQTTLTLYKSVINGTLLDDVNAEIKQFVSVSISDVEVMPKNDVLDILDNIGKAESEDKE